MLFIYLHIFIYKYYIFTYIHLYLIIIYIYYLYIMQHVNSLVYESYSLFSPSIYHTGTLKYIYLRD